MFATPAYAQTAGAAASGGGIAIFIQAFWPILVLFALFYFLMIRPQQQPREAAPGDDRRGQEGRHGRHRRRPDRQGRPRSTTTRSRSRSRPTSGCASVKATLTEVTPARRQAGERLTMLDFPRWKVIAIVGVLAARHAARDPELLARAHRPSSWPAAAAAHQSRPRSRRRQPPAARGGHRRRRQAARSRRWTSRSRTEMRDAEPADRHRRHLDHRRPADASWCAIPSQVDAAVERLRTLTSRRRR